METTNQSNGRQRSVCIVEDDLELSLVLDRILKSIDPHIILNWATTAEDAMESLKAATMKGVRKPYDLIIADILLNGERTGLDLWKFCRLQYPQVPMVVTSGVGIENFLATIDSHAACPPFLPKPFSIHECRDLILNLLNNNDNLH